MHELNKPRMILLNNYWIKVQAELIVKYQAMGNKHKANVSMLEQIRESERKKALKEYYKNYKEEYLTELRMWFKSKNIHSNHDNAGILIPKRSSTKVIKSQSNSSRLLSLANGEAKNKIPRSGIIRVQSHMKKRIQVIGKPKFSYIPIKEEMDNLILRTAGIS